MTYFCQELAFSFRATLFSSSSFPSGQPEHQPPASLKPDGMATMPMGNYSLGSRIGFRSGATGRHQGLLGPPGSGSTACKVSLQGLEHPTAQVWDVNSHIELRRTRTSKNKKKHPARRMPRTPGQGCFFVWQCSEFQLEVLCSRGRGRFAHDMSRFVVGARGPQDHQQATHRRGE